MRAEREITPPPPLGELLDWSGQTAVCIGSGPSLTQADCNKVRKFKTITVNNSWERIPDADVHYGGDLRWWKRYPCEAQGELWSCNKDACWQFGLKYHSANGPYGSGYRAIQLALLFNAERIVLLGYDCTIMHGYHWHGRHRTREGRRMLNPSEGLCRKWRSQYMALRDERIVNASRFTQIEAYPRVAIDSL